MKNVRSFTNGEPLISYILRTLTSINEIESVYVYCSSGEIVKYLPSNVEWIPRDSFYDLATTSFNMIMESFASIIKADTYVLAHATAPFLTADTIRRGINAVNYGGFDSALTVLEIKDFLWADGKPMNFSLDSIPRTQDLDVIMLETCGLYVYQRDLILNKHKRTGEKPYFISVSKIEGVDINTEDDFWLADAIFNFR